MEYRKRSGTDEGINPAIPQVNTNIATRKLLLETVIV